MAESRRLSEAALDGALRDLGAWLDYPPTPDLTGSVRRRLDERPARYRRFGLLSPSPARRLAVAALVLLLVATSLTLALSSGARRAVADRLGLRGVQIVVVASPTAPAGPAAAPASSPGAKSGPTPAASPTATPVPVVTSTATPGSTLGLGLPLTLAQASSRVTFQVLVPEVPGLALPDAVYLDPTPGGMLSLVYAPRVDLPALPGSDVGLLLNEFQGTLDPNLFIKMAAPEQIHPVTVNGATGYWIDGGPHQLIYRDARGNVQSQSDRLAGNTLLWEQGGVTYRLESELTQAKALEIAASLHETRVRGTG